MGKKTNRRFVAVLAAGLAFLLIPVAVSAVGGSFTDDDTSIFEADIEWLSSAGVTAGCNPPTNDQFCPDDNVTRGQMAAFMRRFAQYLGAEDGQVANADQADQATIAGDADTLDGMDAIDFAVAADVYTKAEANARFDPVRTLLTWTGARPVDFSTGAFSFKEVRDIGSFTKLSADTVIRMDLNTHFIGTGGLFCEFQLRVDGVSAAGGTGPDRTSFIGGADSGRQLLEGTMLFEGLGVGSHDVSLWVRSNTGICEENDGNHTRQLQITEEY